MHLIVFLVITHQRGEVREDASEEIIRQHRNNYVNHQVLLHNVKEHTDAHSGGHGPEVAEMAASHTHEHFLGHRPRLHGRLLRHFQRLQLVHLVKEIGCNILHVQC